MGLIRRDRQMAESEADYIDRLEHERSYALRDAELARERADRTHHQHRGAVEERDRYREQAQRFRTIMASASEYSPVECRQMIRDALRGQ